ncbi:unnamed protein product [Arctogadus glacialis]
MPEPREKRSLYGRYAGGLAPQADPRFTARPTGAAGPEDMVLNSTTARHMLFGMARVEVSPRLGVAASGTPGPQTLAIL